VPFFFFLSDDVRRSLELSAKISRKKHSRIYTASGEARASLIGRLCARAIGPFRSVFDAGSDRPLRRSVVFGDALPSDAWPMLDRSVRRPPPLPLGRQASLSAGHPLPEFFGN
jgi:hypothetical protein